MGSTFVRSRHTRSRDDKLLVDDDYFSPGDAGATFAKRSIDDTLMQPVSGEPDPNGKSSTTGQAWRAWPAASNSGLRSPNESRRSSDCRRYSRPPPRATTGRWPGPRWIPRCPARKLAAGARRRHEVRGVHRQERAPCVHGRPGRSSIGASWSNPNRGARGGAERRGQPSSRLGAKQGVLHKAIIRRQPATRSDGPTRDTPLFARGYHPTTEPCRSRSWPRGGSLGSDDE